ncbi:ankyrin repeat domain-containing protein [Thioalkalivibrio sp. ALE16]|uniref:ankyrin repeat domain-containing protein n=1 Tax=Thioalkalivibrio sp. ALE16 TaxID=1158172 RepID=UPI0018CA1278|nr:ankyrin repeat domain-containing protein [Thioalkalivibrio sp. ALE16]
MARNQLFSIPNVFLVLFLSVFIKTAFAFDLPSPLFHAAIEGNVSEIASAIDAGANVDKRDKEGRTALMFASDPLVIETLLDHGANIHARSNSGESALMIAAQWRRPVEVLESLIDHGVDIDARNKEGWTALMSAAMVRDFQGGEGIVEALIQHGANIGASSNEGWTAPMVAARFNKPFMLETLIDHGADAGHIPLHLLEDNPNISQSEDIYWRIHDAQYD